MVEQAIKYKRLGRTSTYAANWLVGPMIRVRLFLGPDHLLLVEKIWFRETYRRFFFKDIQAFVLHKTNHWLGTNLGLAIAAILFGLFAIVSANQTGALVLGIVTGCFLLFLGLNIAAGPTCRCYLKTAVQFQQLHALKRPRHLRKLLDRIRHNIVLSQAIEAPEVIVTAPAAEPPTEPRSVASPDQLQPPG